MGTMSVKQFRMAQFGARLGTRLEGERARETLTAVLRCLPEAGQLRISLDGIDVLSTSFADEAVGKTCQSLVAGAFGERTIVLEAETPELTDGIDIKLTQRRLAMLCRTNQTWRILGLATPALEETLQRIVRKQRTTTRELADELGLQISACTNRVARLAQLRLIRREKIGMKGPQDVYAIHAIVEA